MGIGCKYEILYLYNYSLVVNFRLEKILPLRVWVTRHSDTLLELNKKLPLAGVRWSWGLRFVRLKFLSLKYIGAIPLQVHSQYLEVSHGASHRSQY